MAAAAAATSRPHALGGAPPPPAHDPIDVRKNSIFSCCAQEERPTAAACMSETGNGGAEGAVPPLARRGKLFAAPCVAGAHNQPTCRILLHGQPSILENATKPRHHDQKVVKDPSDVRYAAAPETEPEPKPADDPAPWTPAAPSPASATPAADARARDPAANPVSTADALARAGGGNAAPAATDARARERGALPTRKKKIVLNVANIGHTYAESRGLRGEFAWFGVRQAVQYYQDRDVEPLLIVKPSLMRNNPLWAGDMLLRMLIWAKESTAVGRGVDDVMSMAIAYHEDCGLVDNDNYREWLNPGAEAQADIAKAWLERYPWRRVTYTFDEEGNFLPFHCPEL